MTFEQYSTSSKAKDRLKEYSSKVKESITMVEKINRYTTNRCIMQRNPKI